MSAVDDNIAALEALVAQLKANRAAEAPPVIQGDILLHWSGTEWVVRAA